MALYDGNYIYDHPWKCPKNNHCQNFKPPPENPLRLNKRLKSHSFSGEILNFLMQVFTSGKSYSGQYFLVMLIYVHI